MFPFMPSQKILFQKIKKHSWNILDVLLAIFIQKLTSWEIPTLPPPKRKEARTEHRKARGES